MEKEDLEFFSIEGEITGIDDNEDVNTENPDNTGKPDDNIDKTRAVENDGNEIMDFGSMEDNASEGNASSSSDNLYFNFAKALAEKGVIEEFDDSIFEGEDVDEIEAMINLVKNTVDGSISEYKKRVTGSNLEALEALERGDSIEEYLNIKNDNIKLNNVSKEDLEDDDKASLREKVIRDYYKETTSLSDERINKSIKRLIDLGEDVEESISMADELKAIRDTKATKALEETKLKRTKDQEAFNNQLTALRKNVDDIDLSFLGSNINKNTKDRIYEMLTKPVSKDNNMNAVHAKRKELGANNFDIKLAAFIERGLFDGDLSKISNKQRRTAIDELESSIKRSEYSTGHGGSFGSSKKSTADEIFSRRR